MSGVTGANRVRSRTDYIKVVYSYNSIISHFPGFVSFDISGSYNSRKSQKDFGDVDLIVQVNSQKSKPVIKKDLIKYLTLYPVDIIVPFSSEKYKGRRFYNSGEMVTVDYYDKEVGYDVQIDNIISLSNSETEFKKQFLDWSAEKQGLILGLVKAATVETNYIELFKKLCININNDVILEDNQEFEFTLSSSELQLRKVTYRVGSYKEVDRKVLWRSSRISDVSKLLYEFDLTLSFDELLNQVIKRVREKRSLNRIKGIFKSMVSVKSGEVGTKKGKYKEISLQKIENMII